MRNNIIALHKSACIYNISYTNIYIYIYIYIYINFTFLLLFETTLSTSNISCMYIITAYHKAIATAIKLCI